MKATTNLFRAIATATVLFFIAAVQVTAQVSTVEVSSRDVRKRVKELQKEGWKTMDLPLEQQVKRTMERSLMQDAEGFDKYITKTVIASGDSYSAAQMAAENIAKVRIANDMGSSVSALTDIALKNQEITATEATSITNASEKAKILVSQKLGTLITSTCVYRMRNGQYEVSVTVLYDQMKAINIAHDLMATELMNEAKLADFVTVDNLRKTYVEQNFSEFE